MDSSNSLIDGLEQRAQNVCLDHFLTVRYKFCLTIDVRGGICGRNNDESIECALKVQENHNVWDY